MKTLKTLFILVLLVLVAGTTFAQRGPGDRDSSGNHGGPRGPRNPWHGPRDHRGPGDSTRKGPPCNIMADSCFQILLGKLSADDAAALQAALDAQKAFMDQVNQLRAAAKAAREAHDTAAFRAAMEQLKAIRNQGRDLQRTIRDIMHRNASAVREAMIACCGEPPKGPRDSNDVKGPGHGDHVLGMVTPIKPNPVPTGVLNAEFSFSLHAETTVVITIADQLGNIVKTVANGTFAAGQHQVTLDLAGMTAGMYLVRTQAGNDVRTQHLLIQ